APPKKEGAPGGLPESLLDSEASRASGRPPGVLPILQMYVTTETYKAHLRAREGLPRLPKKKRLERKRQYLRRLSSRESINAYRNRSPPSPQSPKPMDFPNLPSRSPSLGLDLGAIPEVEMDDLWEQVMQSQITTLVDLPNQTMSPTCSH
ncbi:unnamed protein product, partial [Rhizoctonia solani]